MTTKPLMTALAVALFAMAVNAAHADDPAEIRTQRVRISDLDLSTEFGVHRLYHRLTEASKHVCSYHSPFGLVDARCRDKALADAVAAVNSSRLTALHLQTTGVAQVGAK